VQDYMLQLVLKDLVQKVLLKNTTSLLVDSFYCNDVFTATVTVLTKLKFMLLMKMVLKQKQKLYNSMYLITNTLEMTLILQADTVAVHS